MSKPTLCNIISKRSGNLSNIPFQYGQLEGNGDATNNRRSNSIESIEENSVENDNFDDDGGGGDVEGEGR